MDSRLGYDVCLLTEASEEERPELQTLVRAIQKRDLSVFVYNVWEEPHLYQSASCAFQLPTLSSAIAPTSSTSTTPLSIPARKSTAHTAGARSNQLGVTSDQDPGPPGLLHQASRSSSDSTHDSNRPSRKGHNKSSHDSERSLAGSLSDERIVKSRCIINLARPCAHFRTDPRLLRSAMAEMLALERIAPFVYNGSAAISLDSCKANQFRVMRQLNIPHPPVTLFKSSDSFYHRSGAVTYPAVIRSSMCSRNRCAQTVSRFEEVERYTLQHPEFQANGYLIQSMLSTEIAAHGITRLVFIEDKLLFAHKIKPLTDFRPSSMCEAVVPFCAPLIPSTFQDFSTTQLSESQIPGDALQMARKLVRHIGLTFASVEMCIYGSFDLLDDSTHKLLFCDVQAVSHLSFPTGVDGEEVLSHLAQHVAHDLSVTEAEEGSFNFS